jgi:ribosome-binding protein aMBF1 (putative translation factor)
MKNRKAQLSTEIQDHLRHLGWRLDDECQADHPNDWLVSAWQQKQTDLRIDLELLQDNNFAPDRPDLSFVFALGEALIAARYMAGFSQRKLARLVGWETSDIQRYERNGYANCTLRKMQDLSTALADHPGIKTSFDPNSDKNDDKTSTTTVCHRGTVIA